MKDDYDAQEPEQVFALPEGKSTQCPLYVQEYNREVPKPSPSQQQLLVSKLHLQDILPAPHYTKEKQFEICSLTYQHQAMQIKVTLPPYQVLVSLFHIPAPFPETQSHCYGRNAQVIFFTFQGTEIALKRVAIPHFEAEQAVQQIIFQRFVQEFAILKIASALECTPPLPNIFGFEVLMFRDYAVFAMERCHSPDDALQGDLKQLLGRLHCFNVVHCDIKPENIGFCPSVGKTVFIDFGLSEVSDSQIGKKVTTGFKGTTLYASEQMARLVVQGRKGQVDLYWNDYICLQSTIDFVHRNKSNELIMIDHAPLNAPLSAIFEIQIFKLQKVVELQYYLLQKNSPKVQQIMHKNGDSIIKDSKDELLDFLSLLTPDPYYEEFLSKHLSNLRRHFRYEEIMRNIQHSGQQVQFSQYVFNTQKARAEADYCFKAHASLTGSHAQKPPQTTLMDVLMGILQHRDLLSHQEYQAYCWSEVLQVVRFDQKNYDFDSKLKISRLFLEKICSESLNQQVQGLQIIMLLFTKLIKRELKLEFDQVSYKRLITLFYQCILVDLDFTRYLHAIYRQKSYYFRESLTIKLFTIDLAKLSHFSRYKLFTSSIFLFHQIAEATYLFAQSRQPIYLIVKKLAIDIIQSQTNSDSLTSQGAYEATDKIVDTSIREFVKASLLYSYLLKEYCCSGSFPLMISCIQEIKAQIYKWVYREGVLTLDCWVICIFQMTIVLRSRHDIVQFAKIIKDTVNCPIISSTLAFDLTAQVFVPKPDIKTLYDVCRTVFGAPLNQSHFIRTLQNQLLYKVIKVLTYSRDTKRDIVPDCMLKECFNVWDYVKGYQYDTVSPIYLDQIQAILFRLEIILHVCPYKHDEILAMIESLKPDSDPTKSAQQHRLWYIYRALAATFYYNTDQKADAYIHFEATIALLPVAKVRQYCYNNMIKCSKQLEVSTLVLNCQKLLQHCESEQAYFGYFLNPDILKTSLQVFCKQNDEERLYTLMDNLVRAVTALSSKAYVIVWFSSFFLIFVSESIGVLTFDLMRKYIGPMSWKNRLSVFYYLLTCRSEQDQSNKLATLKLVTVQFDSISRYCRRLILPIYFDYVLELNAIGSKQLKFITKKYKTYRLRQQLESSFSRPTRKINKVGCKEPWEMHKATTIQRKMKAMVKKT